MEVEWVDGWVVGWSGEHRGCWRWRLRGWGRRQRVCLILLPVPTGCPAQGHLQLYRCKWVPLRRWKRNQGGAICRKSVRKMLEVLVMKLPHSEHWALPGVSEAASLSHSLTV